MSPAPVSDDESPSTGGGGACAPLSSGACRALGSVLARLLDDSRDGARAAGAAAKRPRRAGGPGLVLGGDEEVAEALEEEVAARAREREGKRERLRYEALARVVPDAATGGKEEKGMKETATKGVVALFNAVAKAQKGGDGGGKGEGRGKAGRGEVVSKEGFMDLIREGIRKEGGRGEKEEEEDGGEEGDAAEWMRDDYMTKAARKVRNFGKGGSGSEDGDEDDGEDDDAELSSSSGASSGSDQDE